MLLSRLHFVILRQWSLNVHHKPSHVLCSIKTDTLTKHRSLQPVDCYSNCRCMSTDGRRDSSVPEVKQETAQITIGEKVKQTTKDASYLGVIIAGVSITGIMFYAVLRELFSGHSPNSVYTDALKLCRNDPEVVDAVGKPIKGYGELSSRGRRRHVSHVEYEKDGINYMRVKFYIEGSRKKGTVYLEVKEGDKGQYEYRYLFIDLDGSPRKTIILKDNRHLDTNLEITNL